MNLRDKPEFSNIMNKAAIIFGKDMGKDFISAYWDMFNAYSIDDFRGAMNKAATGLKWFPKPAELLELIKPKQMPAIDTAQRQATYLINAVLGKNWKNPVGWKTLDKATELLLGGRFNPDRLHETSVKNDLKWIEKNFIDSYMSLSDINSNRQIESGQRQIEA